MVPALQLDVSIMQYTAFTSVVELYGIVMFKDISREGKGGMQHIQILEKCYFALSFWGKKMNPTRHSKTETSLL